MDRVSVELAAMALAQVRAQPEQSMADMKTVFTMLGKFGMNPIDRAGLVTPRR